ncbi:MAG: hypothetical protein SNH01_05245 [Rikenellaceae bacterium]
MKKILSILLSALAFTGCYETVLYNTNHPNEAAVAFEVSLPVTLDGDLTLVFGGDAYTCAAGEIFELPKLYLPGEYTYYIYNEPTSESVSYDTSVPSVIATVATTRSVIESMPDYIYFGMGTVTLEKDTEIVLTPTMNPVIRDLNIELELEGDAKDDLESVTVSLSGVLQQWECISDLPYGTSAEVAPELTITTTTEAVSGSDETTTTYLLEGAVRLLGIMPSETQTLSVELNYVGGNPVSHTFTSDVTDLLSTFNDDKSTPMTLSNSVETPTESNPSGSIDDWTTENKDLNAQ